MTTGEKIHRVKIKIENVRIKIGDSVKYNLENSFWA